MSFPWAAGRKDRLRDWLSADLQRALDARTALERQWLTWLTAYKAPRGPTKEFPFPGSSNETLPAIATDVDQLYAKFMQTLHASPYLWSISPLNERWVKVAKPMQDFLGLLDTQVLGMYGVNKRALLEMCKLGTAIFKTGWTYEQRRITTYDPMGKPVPAIKTRSVPFVDHVRLTDFVLPPDSYAIDPDAQGGAPWVAERIRVSPERLRMLAQAGDPLVPPIDPVDLEVILRFEEARQTLYDSHIQTQTYQRRFANEGPIEKPLQHEVQVGVGSVLPVRQIELWEIHARFPARGDSIYDDLVVLWHQPTRTIVRTQIAEFGRPYDKIEYFPGEGFYGIGIAEQKEMFQRMLSDLYNFGIDGALLANTMMLGAKAGANVVPGEPIFPTKVWITDGNPRDELFPMQMGRLDGALGQFIAMTQTYGERRIGISDIQLGSVNELPGRTPATTMVSLLTEGNRRPDLTIKGMRYEGLSRVGLRVVQLLQRHLTEARDIGQDRLLQVMVDSLGFPEGQLLKDQLLMPMEAAELGLGVTISASSGSSNKEVDRQSTLALLQLAGQVAPQILQFTQMYVQSEAQQPGGPVGHVALAAAQGITELYRRALEQHDVRDPESIVPAFLPSAPLNPTGGAGPLAGPG